MSELAHDKIGRNNPCPCGSGKKFKACCAGQQISNNATHNLEAIHQQAQAAIARSDFADAEQCFRTLQRARPNDAYILASLGQALCWQQRRREGIDYLLKAAKLLQKQARTSNPQFIVDLSVQLIHWGEAVMAERLARLAVTLAPDSPATLNNLSACLSRINHNQEALNIAQRVCQLLPDNPGCEILLAILETRIGEQQQALNRLQRVIERNHDPEQTARAWLESGVILDKLGQAEQAFAALTQAGASQSAISNYHPAQREYLFDTLDNNREGFDKALLQRWSVQQLCQDGLPTPTFLMGFLRSGTTLTEQVIDAHPQLIATDESSIVHETGKELARMTGIEDHSALALRSLSLQQAGQLRQFYWRRMREEYGDQVMRKQLVDKNALNTIDLGLISVLFPEAKILFALRDPRDVCLSCFMQSFTASPATINLLSWEGVARQYEAVMEYWLHLRPLMQPGFIEVRYEDTVNDFEQSYRRVFEFLGVPWSDAVSRFYEKSQGRYISTPSFSAVSQPIYKNAVARWKPYQNQFLSIMPRLQRFIDEFGYGE